MKVLIFILASYISYCFLSCASITTPNGGPKDVRPPQLVSSIPQNRQTNFKGKTIELVFDESVKLNNAKEEIIITPSVGKDVEYKVKGSRVIITPVQPWQDSTTYSILFREGIQDITESNTPNNLKLAFSTGHTIDSLRISGKVTEMLTGDHLNKITVALYSSDTFNIFDDSPSYFTKTNESGRFDLENIKNGKYRIYAFDDKNKNLKVESRNERFGFLADTLYLNKKIDSLSLGLIRLDTRQPKLNTLRNIGKVTRLRFNKELYDYKIESDSDLTHAFGDNQSEINIWAPENLSDSLKVHLSGVDSLDLKVDSLFYIKTSAREVKDAFKWSFNEARVESENGKFTTTLSYNKPLNDINFDSIFILLDTITKIPFDKNNIAIDELHKKILFSTEIDKKIFKTEKEPILSLITGKGFIQTIENDTSKHTTKEIIIYWPETTGILNIQTSTTQKHFIIQLLNSQGKVVTSIHDITKYSFKNLNPEEYQLRIITDLNNNRRWDPGNIELNQGPEPITFYTTSDGKKKFPIRANWELGPLVVKF